MNRPTTSTSRQGTTRTTALESGAAVLITSHDRRFLDTVAQRFVLIRNDRLIEISDPAEFYDAPEAAAADARRRPTETNERAIEDALARIVELEGLLEADRARKPRFQKPDLQQQWQSELSRLYDELE
jgi:ATPase subunit of ABC transporter with duplicated ATPase domains